MEQKPLYITTTLPYVNADPHIGFALEAVQADIIARYHRLAGREVFFNTGTDEHGQKIFQKAAETGQDVQAYVDHYAAQFRKLKEGLNLSNDVFIRTTDTGHIAAAQELWQRCVANIGLDGPDIYKKKYKGLYCVGDEMFLKETDLVSGRCPNHPNMQPVEIEEENYFFRLSRYQSYLHDYLSNSSVILPEWRREEALKFVDGGLEDFSISRETARMSWGIPVPGDTTQVMYVWFDALTNYISTLGWPTTDGNFEKFWNNGEVVQMAGKDQVRFQSIMWQAMLKSGGIKATDTVVYHGFITSGGQKMSKSLGNVIEPLAIANEYGIDALRYFLARHIHPFEDSDFTMERFKELYNANLANGLGNLVRRVITLARNNGVELEKDERDSFDEIVRGNDQIYHAFIRNLEGYKISDALDMIFGRDVPHTAIGWMDNSITQNKPFELVKTDLKAGQKAIWWLMKDLWSVATLLDPIMPDASIKIREAIVENKTDIPMLFPRKE